MAKVKKVIKYVSKKRMKQKAAQRRAEEKRKILNKII